MIFVDANVFMYALGRAHELQDPARAFFYEANRNRTALCTSAEVLQELLHAYLPAGRVQGLDDATALVASSDMIVWPLEEEHVTLARQLADQYPSLQAGDLCYLASCRRWGVKELMTFDAALQRAMGMESSGKE